MPGCPELGESLPGVGVRWGRIVVVTPYWCNSNGWWEDRFGFFLTVHWVMAAGESISLAILVPWAVGNSEMKTCEEQGPPCLPGIKYLCAFDIFVSLCS